MRRYLCLGFILMFILTGCAEQEMSGAAQSNLSLNKADRDSHAEVPDGDFVYRLVSEKEHYEPNEKVQVYGELEYVGEEAEITIGHAASAFYFPMKELIRDYNISYAMNEPYITTTLKKGEPLREYYSGGGGYNGGDDKQFKAFIHSLRNGFPEGEYVVYGSADFMIDSKAQRDSNREEPKRYKIQAEIEFSVSDESK
ncbi:hypothetical protein AWU65_13620 [Paenibacillus glucanolyticus]|uniref:Lipoprotein n=2 Tax=Paenibacillus TaxID=44249 RepID=A0A163JZ44_9BACL|nr:hypothetical protein B9D94_24855 [Paenibacillus sp. Cedars]KZS46887.1 hypothetical protein AWU65_13620 [Paenibacillus glucanolyticus]